MGVLRLTFISIGDSILSNFRRKMNSISLLELYLIYLDNIDLYSDDERIEIEKRFEKRKRQT